MQRKWWKVISLTAIFAAVIAKLKSKEKTPTMPDTFTVLPQAAGLDIRKEISLGSATQVASLLKEYGDYLRSQGVNTAWFSPQELTRLRRDGRFAIPPRHLWANMARTIVLIAQPIREQFGRPIRIYNAYRPGWYNAQVSSAPNSIHIYNAALDMLPIDSNRRSNTELAELGARMYKLKGQELAMGLGVYGSYPHPVTGVHVDMTAGAQSIPSAVRRPALWASAAAWVRNTK